MIIIRENNEISDAVWYHVDLNDNVKPDIDNRPKIGLHCGTLDHALNRCEKSYLYEVRLNNLNFIDDTEQAQMCV